MSTQRTNSLSDRPYDDPMRAASEDPRGAGGRNRSFMGNAEPICFASVDGVTLRRERQITVTGAKQWRWVSDWLPGGSQ